MARYKDSKRDEALTTTRRKLLAAAGEEFARQGYRGANINDISLAAGFAKGTIYNYFPSKRALLLDLLAEVAEEHLEFMTGQVLQESDASDRLVLFFEAGFAYVNNNPAQAQVMINTLFGADSELKRFMYQAYWPMFQLLSDQVISRGIAQAQFVNVDPEATSELLMTIYLGAGSQVDERGKVRMSAQSVASFAMRALGKQP